MEDDPDGDERWEAVLSQIGEIGIARMSSFQMLNQGDETLHRAGVGMVFLQCMELCQVDPVGRERSHTQEGLKNSQEIPNRVRSLACSLIDRSARLNRTPVPLESGIRGYGLTHRKTAQATPTSRILSMCFRSVSLLDRKVSIS